MWQFLWPSVYENRNRYKSSAIKWFLSIVNLKQWKSIFRNLYIDLTCQFSVSLFTDFRYQSIKITWLLPIFIDLIDYAGTPCIVNTVKTLKLMRWSLLNISGVPFPKNFLSIAKTILKRLFRVYAHIYHQHFLHIVGLGEEAHLNTSFKHFMFFVQEFSLVDKRELAPLQELIEKLTNKDKV